MFLLGGFKMKYHIGTKFKTRHKIPFIYTVIDFHTTTNSKGETVKERYVCSHQLCGQTVYDYDVVQTTIDMSTILEE